jgi:drug/metabolite transporter (DMT)-like permease
MIGGPRGATACIGAYFWALGSITPTLGWLWPVMVTRMVRLFGAGLALLSVRQQPVVSDRSSAPLVVAAALFETIALVAFTSGLGETNTSMTPALAPLYSTVAVILGWLSLRERLAPTQCVGIGVILGGVVLLSLGGERARAPVHGGVLESRHASALHCRYDERHQRRTIRQWHDL